MFRIGRPLGLPQRSTIIGCYFDTDRVSLTETKDRNKNKHDMTNKLAIDWDETELRLVAARCSGDRVSISDAAVIPIADGNIFETLRAAIQQRGLEKTETLVAIGRGRAELRELQLPPVSDDDLPDMVRYQAIRNFASAGDSSTVDFLVTKRTPESVEMIAAAVGPTDLSDISKTCESADLEIKRISLRPLAAAALYLNQHHSGGDTVLIDLLANDAEIVVARDGRVIFVRTVRMPNLVASRGKALAGELRRSLAACGSRGSLDRVILWGRESVHAEEKAMLAEASGSEVDVLDPFDLVDVDRKANANLPDHVGRLAPLVGLLVADVAAPDRLVDFLNPRRRPEEKPNPYRKFAMIGVPVAVAALIGFVMYRQLSQLDREIESLTKANARETANVDRASNSIRRTEIVDAYLDGNVNWLDEIERLAVSMPPSDQMIVRRIGGSVDDRRGGGTLTVVGGVTEPDVIHDFENALRDDQHHVTGDGVSEKKTDDGYRFGFTEAISIDAETLRSDRYTALNSNSPNPTPPESTEPESTAEAQQ